MRPIFVTEEQEVDRQWIVLSFIIIIIIVFAPLPIPVQSKNMKFRRIHVQYY